MEDRYEAAWLRAEDYRWRSGRVGRRTRRARKRRMPAPARARQVPGGSSTPGTNLDIKDQDRTDRGPRMREDGGVHGSSGHRPGGDVTGSAVGKDSDGPFVMHLMFEYADCWVSSPRNDV